MKDWNGNAQSAFTCNGASNHSSLEREANDYYATEPKAVEELLKVENFKHDIWECACGEGHISKVLIEHGYDVYSTDLYDRGYKGQVTTLDFLEKSGGVEVPMDIVTNPPYKFAKEFVETALEKVQEGCKIAMLLKLTFLESKKRRELFDTHPPKFIYVFSSRVQCAKNGDFDTYKKGTGTAIAYAWYVWEKGFKGEPVVRWIN